MSQAARGRYRREKAVLVDVLHSQLEQPASTSSLRKHVEELSMYYNRASEKNGRVLQPMSPTSYNSSMEVGAYKPPLTPTSSLDFRGRLAETSYSLRTSAELLKVLNRIWTLEEQHASNTALVGALKEELDHARSRIQELTQKHQADRHEVSGLAKKLMEDKLIRRAKEQEKIKAAVQYVRDELERERQLRKQSETLGRKLAKELRDVKTALSKPLDELEKEKEDRILLEELSDKFAKAVRVYEQDIRSLRHKYEKDYAGTDDDKLMVHIAEAWLDGREQLKQIGGKLTEKEIPVVELSYEVEAFFTAQLGNSLPDKGAYGKNFQGVRSLRRHSLESININGVISAPHDGGDVDSAAGNFYSAATNKINDANDASSRMRVYKETAKTALNSDITKPNKLGSKVIIKGRRSLQEKLEGKINIPVTIASTEEEIPHESKEMGEGKKNKSDAACSRELEDSTIFDAKDHLSNNLKEESHGYMSRRRGHSAKGGSGDIFPGAGFGVKSPVQQWNVPHASDTVERVESAGSKGKMKQKGSSLKAKLLEARLEGQNARLRGSNVGQPAPTA